MTTPGTGEQREFTAEEDYPLSWAIFSLARSHRALAASLMSPLGIFPGQEIILFQLWARDGLSQKEIGEFQRLDHSTITRSIARLEAAGLLTRSRSPLDGRVTLVHLTDAGRVLEAPTKAAWAELEKRTAGSLSSSLQSAFRSGAADISRGLDGGVTPARPA